MGPLHWVVLLSALQAAQPMLITGTLKDRPILEARMTRTDLKPSARNRYRISGFPTLILLDPDGIIVEIGGHIQTMLPRLAQLLEKRK